MLWLTWRQFRTQAAVVLGVLAVIGVALAVTGPHLVHLYDSTVGDCAKYGDCDVAESRFLTTDHLLQLTSDLLLVAPALLGMFWGAPLVARELETGTHKLAWTQSVTRTRWLAGKVGLVGLASVLTAGLFSLMVTWWSSPLDRVADNAFAPSFYDRRDLVPIGYAAFAFALGVTAGLLVRRTLPAMATTLVAFVAVRYAFEDWVRPHLMAPLRLVTAANAGPNNGSLSFGRLNPADWVLSEETVNRAGQAIGHNGGGGIGALGLSVSSGGTLTIPGAGTCPNKVPFPQPGAPANGPPGGAAFNRGLQECVDKLGIHQILTYQPIDRYWPFQWYETGLFVAAALVLIGVCFWWVRHRLA
ncbi:MAG: ABC transporter permease [Acidimicrobiales bacterium]